MNTLGTKIPDNDEVVILLDEKSSSIAQVVSAVVETKWVLFDNEDNDIEEHDELEPEHFPKNINEFVECKNGLWRPVVEFQVLNYDTVVEINDEYTRNYWSSVKWVYQNDVFGN